MTEHIYRISDEVLPQKIHEIFEKGLTTANIEHAYKLIDMYKDLKEVEHWETEDQQEGQYSQRGRRRDRMGRYAQNDGLYSSDNGKSYEDKWEGNNYQYPRADNRGTDAHRRYMEAKQSFRSTKSVDCKRKLMDTVDEYMDSFARQMEEMLRDSDCKEERDTIQRYIQKIRELS